MKFCVGEDKEREYAEFVNNQILGKSQIQYFIPVDVTLKDVLMGIDTEMMFKQ